MSVQSILIALLLLERYAQRGGHGYHEPSAVDAFAVFLNYEQLAELVDRCVTGPARVDGHGDHWETDYLVLCHADRPIVISAGRDRLFGTSDDVISGERNDPDARARHGAWWPRSATPN